MAKKTAEFDLLLRVKVEADDILVDKAEMISIMSQLLAWPAEMEIGGVTHGLIFVDVITDPTP
ncbi:MAG: hypothetical protein ACXAEN_20400 [Candidatus Thorarchaeota archaeon]